MDNFGLYVDIYDGVLFVAGACLVALGVFLIINDNDDNKQG